ncbi:hypothetical protein GA0116948_105293 [Chitinophaga costaii]|uniref:Uncharacterized protein n=1 Tax=Chitinophaga costaii TaxID=1335309 RepID=A0A1C4DIH8_9BACT|nr:DUF5672 family protein [Chitinophaga costaii]SCC31167.1 hypothetical protein GA0116948_105293 [Chitinophaga costaii]
MDVTFYQLFKTCELMMTYELAAYIFSADIPAQHGFEFEFMVVPMFESYWDARTDANFLPVLNSVFSIRPDATHTFNVPQQHAANLPTGSLEGPLMHPVYFTPE